MRLKDLAGKRFGKLTVVAPVRIDGKTHWECKCDCGKTCYKFAGPLGQGRYKSCGCMRLRTGWGEAEEYLLANRKITSNGCWEWTRARHELGYGLGSIDGAVWRVTRVAAILWMGMPKDSKQLVCHTCDNPACFNPDHLFLGSMTDNIQDCIAKKRFRGGEYQRAKTHCPQGHEYTPENTYISPSRRRTCRHCHR